MSGVPLGSSGALGQQDRRLSVLEVPADALTSSEWRLRPARAGIHVRRVASSKTISSTGIPSRAATRCRNRPSKSWGACRRPRRWPRASI